MKESKSINKSIICFAKIIECLRDENAKHVPYRDSKLTRLLQEYLSKKSKNCIIGTISPSNLSKKETFRTLKFCCLANVK